MQNPTCNCGIVAAFLSFLLATAANAAPPTDESIDALLVAQRAERNLGLVLQYLEQLKQEAVRIELKDKELSSDQQRSLNEQMEACLSAVREEVTWENLRPMYRQVYKEVFSQDEIDGLIAFYKSPVGVALLEKQPIALQKTSAIVRERMAGWREKFHAAAKQALESKTNRFVGPSGRTAYSLPCADSYFHECRDEADQLCPNGWNWIDSRSGIMIAVPITRREGLLAMPTRDFLSIECK